MDVKSCYPSETIVFSAGYLCLKILQSRWSPNSRSLGKPFQHGHSCKTFWTNFIVVVVAGHDLEHSTPAVSLAATYVGKQIESKSLSTPINLLLERFSEA